jgi:hypothetical protein
MVKIVSKFLNDIVLEGELDNIKNMLGNFFENKEIDGNLEPQVNGVSCYVYSKDLTSDELLPKILVSVELFGWNWKNNDNRFMRVGVSEGISFNDYKNAIKFANNYEKNFNRSVLLNDYSGYYNK